MLENHNFTIITSIRAKHLSKKYFFSVSYLCKVEHWKLIRWWKSVWMRMEKFTASFFIVELFSLFIFLYVSSNTLNNFLMKTFSSFGLIFYFFIFFMTAVFLLFFLFFIKDIETINYLHGLTIQLPLSFCHFYLTHKVLNIYLFPFF